MEVACLIKLLITRLSDPVSDHGEVHVTVITHGNIILPCPVVQVILTESPVAAQWDKPPTVDKDLQGLVIILIPYLTDTVKEIYVICALFFDN